jgi:hypothetical protein
VFAPGCPLSARAEKTVRDFLTSLTGKPVSEDILGSLKNGVILCEAMNKVRPGAIKKINAPGMPFKEMENITFFIKACREELKMLESDLFTSADLYDGKSLFNVCAGIRAFSRAAEKAGFKGGSIAPREATAQAGKQWDINPNAAVSKLNMGSSTTMQAHGVEKHGPTFGAEHSKTMYGSNAEPAKLNMGSSATMAKTEISRANDITFGHDAGKQGKKP